MRKITALALAALMVISLSACGSSTNSSPDTTETSSQAQQSNTKNITENNADAEINSENTVSDKQNKVLILYFSANNTKDVDAVSSATTMIDGASSVQWIADIIHDTAGGDLVPIIPSEDYPLGYNELADYAKKEQSDGGRPAFEDLGVDPASYDTVFIGYPIWWYEMPMIMDTLFETYDFSGVTIIPFNTHEGSRDGGTYKDIQEHEPNTTVLEGLAVRGQDAGQDSAKMSVTEWLGSLGF